MASEVNGATNPFINFNSSGASQSTDADRNYSVQLANNASSTTLDNISKSYANNEASTMYTTSAPAKKNNSWWGGFSNFVSNTWDVVKNIGAEIVDGINTKLQSIFNPTFEKGKLNTVDDLKEQLSASQLTEYADMAELSIKTYMDDPEYTTDPLAGWRRISENEFETMLGQEVNLDDSATGFQASFYQNDQGKTVLSFRGSEAPNAGMDEFLNDWVVSDGGQALLDVPKSYEQARALAAQAKQVFGDDLQLIGHSLGGGMANYAAIDQNLDYTIFNAAGLADWTVDALGDKVGSYTGEGIVINDEYDPLTNMGRNQIDETFGHDAKHVGYDALIWIKGESGMNFADAHNLVNVKNVLNEAAA